MHDSAELRVRLRQFDDGELTDVPEDAPYSVVFPPQVGCPVIYTTKVEATRRLLGENCRVGLFGRYGLPRDEDILAIARLVQGHGVSFLGDCDPFDLVVYAWLRGRMPIQYLGISDEVIMSAGAELPETATIVLSDAEAQALALLDDVWPDFPSSIGPLCTGLLRRRRKLEL